MVLSILIILGIYALVWVSAHVLMYTDTAVMIAFALRNEYLAQPNTPGWLSKRKERPMAILLLAIVSFVTFVAAGTMYLLDYMTFIAAAGWYLSVTVCVVVVVLIRYARPVCDRTITGIRRMQENDDD